MFCTYYNRLVNLTNISTGLNILHFEMNSVLSVFSTTDNTRSKRRRDREEEDESSSTEESGILNTN